MLQIGEFRFEAASRDLIAASSNRRLSPKAAEVLLVLHEAQGRVCARADILDRVWPNLTVGEEVLTHAIAELRRAFGDDRRAPRYVETVHKRGYRLRAEAAPAAPAHAGSVTLFDLEAYCLCVEAQDAFDLGGRRHTAQAIELYERAAGSRPHFGTAHAGLAKALVFSGVYYKPDQSAFQRAEEHCAVALEAQPRSAGALASLGLLKEARNELAEATHHYGLSLALDPNNRETHFLLGRCCLMSGELRAAIAILERAAHLRPDDFHSLMIAGKLRAKLNDDVGARGNFVRALQRTRSFLLAYPDSYRALRCQANCLWHLGQEREALALVDRLRDHADPMPYYTASFLALIGEFELAMETLSDAVADGWRHGAFLAADPDFDAFRSEPRFKRLARAVDVAA